MKLGEFFVEVLVDAGNGTLTLGNLITKFGELDAAAVGAVGILGTAAQRIQDISYNAIEAAHGFSLFSMQTGLSAQELQKWQVVAQQAGVSSQAVATSVSNLQKNLADISIGRGNIAPFQMLGINTAGQSAFGVLSQVRDRIKGLNPAMATNLLTQMGIDPSMIAMLNLSNEKFKEFTKTTYIMTEQQQKSFEKSRVAISEFNLVSTKAGYDIATVFGPVFMRGVEGAGNVVTFLSEGIQGIASYMQEFPAAAGVMIAALAMLGTAISPLLTLATLLGLIFEDIENFRKGNQSLVGSDWQSIKDMNKLVKQSGAGGAIGLLPGAALEFASKHGYGGGAEGLKLYQNSLNVNIDGARDPQEIARHINELHKKQISDAQKQSNNSGTDSPVPK